MKTGKNISQFKLCHARDANRVFRGHKSDPLLRDPASVTLCNFAVSSYIITTIV